MRAWDIFRYIGVYFLFWVLLGFLDRLVFLGTFLSKHPEPPLSEVLAAFWHGLAMDFSLASYISALPFLFFFSSLFLFRSSKYHLPTWPLRLYTLLFILVFISVSATNLVLYLEWSEKISFKAFDLFWESPREALASVRVHFLMFSILAVLALVWLTFLLFQRIFPLRRPQGLRMVPLYWSIPLFFVGLFVLFTFIRGGYGRAPMNPSMAYYSSSPFLNHAAVNTHWYLMDDMLKYKSSRHPFQFFTQEEVDELLKELYPQSDTTSPLEIPQVLNVKQPNVILILLEGFSGDLLPSLGGEQGITPGLDQLITQGLLFDQVYSVAERSDKGVVGLLSGFPAQGTQSIVRNVNKAEKLPVLAEDFLERGYQTSFYYGGQSEFYNLKSYVLTHGFRFLVDLEDFRSDDPRTSWGVYDEVLFDRHLADLSLQAGPGRPPFFSTIYTLTNHHPFELRGEYRFGRQDMGQQFRSTAFYTDSVLMDYLEKARTKDWYEETLFVITADHGHRLPSDQWGIHQPQRHRIPLLFFGAPLEESFRGKRVSKIGSQTDLIATLYAQLGWSADRFHWSKNLLDPHVPGSAFYNWADGFGLLTEQGLVSYDFIGHQTIEVHPDGLPDSEAEHLVNQGKAILQRVFDEYLAF